MLPTNNRKPGRVPPARTTTVLILDDHVLFRDGLESLLSGEPGFRGLHLPEDDPDIIEFAQRNLVDLLLIDVAPDDRTRLELVKRLVTELPEKHVIILTETYTDESLFDALRAGAQGYILKDAPFAELVSSLRMVLEGEIALSRQMTSRLVHEYRRMGKNLNPGTGPLNSLSLREIEILEHLGRGASNREIAAALEISEHTVKSHIRNILEKLQLKNRAQAATFARRNTDNPLQ